MPYLIFSIIFYFGIVVLLCMMGVFLKMKTFYKMNKNSPYECGFELINPVYMYFSLQFYIIGLIFILFDLELILLLPLVKTLSNFFMSWMAGYLFFSILSMGFIYENKKNFLSWK